MEPIEIRAGITRLEDEGLVYGAEGDLLDIEPLRLPHGAKAPSSVIAEGRVE